MARHHVGTSGWNYAHWKEVFYPHGLAARHWLDFYARHFDCVEVNATFYRLPTPGSVARWAETVPPSFRFAVKGSRFLTHMKRLLDRGPGVQRFFEAIEPFGRRRGPILWQLPPNFRPDFGRLRDFLDALPPGPHAVEVRDAAWLCDELFVLLEDRKAALVVHDYLDGPWPWPPPGPFVYQRFHRSGTPDYLYGTRRLRRHVKDYEQVKTDTWVFFNNDQLGAALADAMTFRRLLGLSAPPPRPEAPRPSPG